MSVTSGTMSCHGFQCDGDLSTSDQFDREKLIAALGNRNMSVFYDMWRSYCPVHVWKHLRETNVSDAHRYNALHVAVVREDIEIVKAILYGMDPENDAEAAYWKFDILHARTSRGWTTLHLAVVSENEHVLKLLMEQYNSVHQRPEKDWDFADYCWMTPLHYAVLKNLKVQMKLLLEWELYRRHVNARDFFQRTPLHMAACHRPLSIDDFLACDRVDFNAVDCVMHTPLHWAICFGREEIVKSLVKKLNHVESFDLDIEGRSALEMALDDVLADPNDAAETENSGLPEECDAAFLTTDSFKVHRGRVSTRIRSELLTIPAVKAEVERSHRSLQIYLNATNSTLVVAALIANASFSRLPPAAENVEGLHSYFYVARSLAFYTSIMALVASFLALHSLGKTLFGGARLKEIQFALRRIAIILGMSIVGFLAAFFDANWISTSPMPTAYFSMYQAFALAGLLFCFLAVLDMPFSHGKIRFYEQQEDLSEDQKKDLENLVSKLYPEILYKKLYWRKWQVECARTNAIKAFASFRLKTAEKSQQDDQAQKYRFSYYIDFIRSIVNVPKGQEFSPPTPIEGLWMWLFDISKYVPKSFFPLYIIIPLWKFPGKNFRMFVVCSLLGDHFAESYCHGKLYPKHVPGIEGQNTAETQTPTPQDTPKFPVNFAAVIWRKRKVSTEILPGVQSMERKIKRIERVYEEKSEGVCDVSTAAEARDLLSFLDRLPRGIFYWINIWFFPKKHPKGRHGRGFFYWMNFWFTNGQIIPPKFPIVTFYQGYVFHRDHVKSRQISVEAQKAVDEVLKTFE